VAVANVHSSSDGDRAAAERGLIGIDGFRGVLQLRPGRCVERRDGCGPTFLGPSPGPADRQTSVASTLDVRVLIL
jgi:hypothetical protein